jgi:hypothetical protein
MNVDSSLRSWGHTSWSHAQALSISAASNTWSFANVNDSINWKGEAHHPRLKVT